MIRSFLFWLTSKLPARSIEGPRGEPYLERYFLFELFGLGAYIHRFVASDPDRGLHDHPWGRSLSWILVGSYLEIRPEGSYMRKRWRFNLIRGTDFHRVILRPPHEDVWTLFLHGRRTKGWGFLREGRFIPAADAGEYPNKEWWRAANSGAEVRAARLSDRLNAIVRECGIWADTTFAPEGDYRGSSIVAHLKKEVDELAADPGDMEEIADCFLLLCHLAHQNRGNLQIAVARKFAINKRRTWGKPDKDGVVEHVRESA